MCDSLVARVLRDNVAVDVDSPTAGGGNPQRNYCFVAPAGTTEIQLRLEGGSCEQGCIGDDMHLYIEAGDVPDAFDPDDSTKTFAYTPGNGFHVFETSGKPGPYYIGIIDDANTLGYRDVAMKVVR